MPALTGDINDPEFRRARARHAALARTTIDAHIAAIEKNQDDLTPDQRDRLARIVAGAPVAMVGKTTYVGKKTAIVTIPGQRTMDEQLRENGVHV